jgi:hypothetical protein
MKLETLSMTVERNTVVAAGNDSNFKEVARRLSGIADRNRNSPTPAREASIFWP